MNEKKIGKLRKIFAIKDIVNLKLDMNNPYDRYLQLAEAVMTWRRFFIIAVALLFISVCTNIRQSEGKSYEIVKVEVDRATGGIYSSNVIKTINKVDEKNISYFLTKFILDIRNIPLDNNYYNEKIKEVSYFLTAEAQNKLKKVIEESKASEKFFERKTTIAKVLTVNKITNVSNTYQVRWQEITFNDSGKEEKKELFVSSITIDFVKPDSEEMATINPFGIIIKDFTLSKES